MKIAHAVLPLLVCFLLLQSALAQTADPQLLAEIHKIKAIDNHSHPPRVVGPGEKDDEFDILPCDPLEPSDPTTISRPENPQFLAAWKALYGYPYNDSRPEHLRELLQKKQKVMQDQGDNFPNWVLDQLGIETELANRVAMGRGLQPPRFRWVPFDDALLLPLNNSSVANDTPDRKFFYAREEMLLKSYLKDLHLSAVPATLQEYVENVIAPALESQKRQGAVAIKFEAAYMRSLDFGPVTTNQAGDLQASTQVYARYVKGGVPPRAEYIRLQDYLVRAIAREAGRLGLPVHFHTGGGCGSYFMLNGSNPALLEGLLNDPSLRKTKFVLVHGGAAAFTKYTDYLLMKPNVYADFSEQTWLISTRKLSEVLRDWLEWYPEKVLFGTDLYPNTPEINWEEVGWQTTQSGREALAIALTGMMQDGQISRERALELARMALHDNAAKLYGWGKPN
ncbi:MAG TPA: amidohydrolase family protein [Candidatus Saccharimonadales bacterium]|jgi:predicted TIM-barrel fold metal-dependent hydrolase|nr:amidohydrolase family protein [Candidatus Saccharimonadales bacterium]